MKYPNLLRHCYKTCNEYMPSTSVIFTEKPTTQKNETFDYNSYKEEHLKTKNLPPQSSVLICESTKSDLENITDSFLSRSNSINLSENTSFDFGINIGELTDKSDLDINVEKISENEMNIKRTTSILNCCAFVDKHCGDNDCGDI